MDIANITTKVDFLNVLLWRFNEATTLTKLVTEKQLFEELNNNNFWQDWYTDVFNLQTANEFGLSVWAIILDQPIHLSFSGTPELPNNAWGFGSFRKNFNNGNFGRSNGDVRLTDEEARIVLKLKYFKLVTRADAFSINAFLAFAFGSLNTVFMLDGLNMTMTYYFDSTPSSSLIAALVDYDLLPRPAGVGIKYYDLSRATFGFGSSHKNFNNGTFIGSII